MATYQKSFQICHIIHKLIRFVQNNFLPNTQTIGRNINWGNYVALRMR